MYCAVVSNYEVTNKCRFVILTMKFQKSTLFKRQRPSHSYQPPFKTYFIIDSIYSMFHTCALYHHHMYIRHKLIGIGRAFQKDANMRVIVLQD